MGRFFCPRILPLFGNDSVPEYLDDMTGLPACGMRNLLPTRDPIGNNFDTGVSRRDGWEEALAADFHRDIIMFCFIAKGPGHTTAA
jgi:hypothetical protein